MAFLHVQFSVAAAIGFGAGIARTNKKKGVLFKCISILGACLIGLGYTLNSYFVQTSKHGDTTSIRLSFLPLMAGTALMSTSLPNFVAYSELLRGRIPYLPPHRCASHSPVCSPPAHLTLQLSFRDTDDPWWPCAVLLRGLVPSLLVGSAESMRNGSKASTLPS